MNKKIYFNHKFIALEEGDSQPSQDQSIKIYKDDGELNLKKITDDFLNEKNGHSIKIITKNAGGVLNSLKKLFHYIEAAGGFIEKDQQFLFIHRHGRWDLPKGKLEKNETIENAAVRECEEECGIRNLTITKPLSSTFHLYAYKNSFALKQTFWFYMTTNFSEQLKPQLEEDIDEVKWFDKSEIHKTVLNDTYYTISDITREGLNIG